MTPLCEWKGILADCCASQEWEECVDMYRDDADGYVNKCFEQASHSSFACPVVRRPVWCVIQPARADESLEGVHGQEPPLLFLNAGAGFREIDKWIKKGSRGSRGLSN